jgi:Mg2+-importing ATPase
LFAAFIRFGSMLARHGRPGVGSEDPAPWLRRLAALDERSVLAELDTAATGLAAAEAQARLVRYGPNAVASSSRLHPLRRLGEQFLQPLPLLLVALAIVTDLTGETDGALVIAIIVLLSVVLGFVQEYRSERAAEKLRAMVRTTATVLRHEAADAAGSQPLEIPLEAVVPGDVVRLSAGDLLPADVRLLAAKDLFVNQSTLTGEAIPVEKSAALPDARADAHPLELPNLCFTGSSVVNGTATALVLATGPHTLFGVTAAAVGVQREATGFDRGMQRFIRLMLRFMLVMVPVVFLINGFGKGHWAQALLFSAAVAVGLTPELLPMIVTITLAKGALAMARQQVIVKRLTAIQNFGAMDVLCTDKTGTLTQDRVILERYVDGFGAQSRGVLEHAYLNSLHQTGLKNLLDRALLERGAQLGATLQHDWTKLDEVPFDFERRRMSVAVAGPNAERLLICKGAVDEVLAVCAFVQRAERVESLAGANAARVRTTAAELNADGFRVIAVAARALPASQATCGVADERGLTLCGYIAFLDPPKDSAAAAVAALREYGVAIKLLTGDNDAVARYVARHVGLGAQRIVLGPELDALDDEALGVAAERDIVFAKLTPQHKSRIVAALRRRGHVVGFLGDGINDAPALKAADVGVSVDTAVDVARETADIILLRKDLLVLKDGVLEGRAVFGNIVKYIRMGASANLGNALSVLGASAFLPFLPMLPVQILLNNLLYDASQTALATDTVDPDYLQRPRRWEIDSLARYMIWLGPLSSLFDYVTFGFMLAALHWLTRPELFQTGWFVESLLTQTLVVHVLRTARRPFIDSRPSLALGVTTIAICGLGLWLPSSSFAPALGMAPLPRAYWLVMPLIVVTYLLVAQLVNARLVSRSTRR